MSLISVLRLDEIWSKQRLGRPSQRSDFHRGLCRHPRPRMDLRRRLRCHCRLHLPNVRPRPRPRLMIQAELLHEHNQEKSQLVRQVIRLADRTS